MSDTVRAAGQKATQALEDAKQATIDAGKKELTKAKDDVTNAFQAKVKRGIGSLGLGFAENRGEQLGKT